MGLKFFVIPVRDSEVAETELNHFLRGHRVLSVERHWVEQGSNSFWSICVDFLELSTPRSPSSSNGKGRIDYKEILSPEDFAIFAKLRDLRKQIAAEEAIPVYTIFNNEQLAQIVKTKANTKSGLQKIAGIGEAKIEKYGHRFLEILSEQWKDSHETSGEPVGKDSGP